MLLEKSVLEKHIRNSNFQYLANYLAKFQNPEIPEEIINLSRQKFLESNDKTISRSFSIFKLFAPYTNPKNLADFQSDEAYIAKYSQYVEHKTNRDILKILDNKLEKDYIFPIKYPKSTNFVRKLLHLPPKRKSLDILDDFKEHLPDMILKCKEEIMKDERLKDISGNLIISPEKLNMLVYERIALKAQKQLRLDKMVIDDIFQKRNEDTCTLINNNIILLQKNQHIENEQVINQITKYFHDLIPPYMMDKLSSTKLEMQNPQHNPQIEELNANLKQLFNRHIQHVDHELQNKKNKNLYKDTVSILYNLNRASTNNIADPTQATYYKNELGEAQKKYYNSLSSQALNAESFPPSKLCEFEKEGIVLMSRVEILNTQEQAYLANFIDYAINNKSLNNKLGVILKKDNILTQDTNYIEALKELHKFTYKTSHLLNTQTSIEKLNQLMEKYEKNKNISVSTEEKVTLKDLGYVIKLFDGDIKKSLSKWGVKENANNSNTIIDTNNKKTKTLLHLMQNKTIWEKFQDIVGSEVKIRDGNLIMDVAQQYHDVNLHRPTVKTKIQDFITPYSHAAIGLENHISHVWGEYEIQNIDTVRALSSEQFEIHPGKLVSHSMKALLKSTLGKEFDEIDQEISTRFQSITQLLHSESEFNKDVIKEQRIHNNASRRMKAGLADIIPLGHIGKEKVGKWAKKVIDQREEGKTIQEILGKETNNTMICSEFTAKMTVLALAQLDKELTKMVQEKNPNFVPPAEGIVKLPFSPNEDLSKLSPARLIKQLKRSGALDKVETKGISEAAIIR